MKRQITANVVSIETTNNGDTIYGICIVDESTKQTAIIKIIDYPRYPDRDENFKQNVENFLLHCFSSVGSVSHTYIRAFNVENYIVDDDIYYFNIELGKVKAKELLLTI